MRRHPASSFTRTVKMTPCDYQILEYTDSELRTHGVPFIVILRFHMRNSYTLTGYVLRDWETKIKALPSVSLVMSKFFWKIFGITAAPHRNPVPGSLIAWMVLVLDPSERSSQARAF